jgi:hypothetical protein
MDRVSLIFLKEIRLSWVGSELGRINLHVVFFQIFYRF